MISFLKHFKGVGGLQSGVVCWLQHRGEPRGGTILGLYEEQEIEGSSRRGRELGNFGTWSMMLVCWLECARDTSSYWKYLIRDIADRDCGGFSHMKL